MKYSDPLTPLQYMGGQPPFHFALAIYSGYIYFVTVPQFKCAQKVDDFEDIFFIFVVHIICLIFHFLNKSIQSSELNGQNLYSKSYLNLSSKMLYLAAYLRIQYKRNMTDAKNYEQLLRECFLEEAIFELDNNAVSSAIDYHDIVSYRRFEVGVFFSQIFSLFFYGLFCKAYVKIKDMCNKDKKRL